MYRAYDVITPVSNLDILLLVCNKDFSKPYGPINSTDPLSNTLVVCPPNCNIFPDINLL